MDLRPGHFVGEAAAHIGLVADREIDQQTGGDEARHQHHACVEAHPVFPLKSFEAIGLL
jgi:hypothetical protein